MVTYWGILDSLSFKFLVLATLFNLLAYEYVACIVLLDSLMEVPTPITRVWGVDLRIGSLAMQLIKHESDTE